MRWGLLIMAQKYWHIEGFNGLEKIYGRTVKFGYLSENQLVAVLKTLTARAGLGYDEILGAYAKRGTKIANQHLLTIKDKNTYMCGDNPHFIARVI